MKIKLNLYIFAIITLFIITKQIELYILVMSFALIHEIFHLICGIILGFKPEFLRILPLGFSVEFKKNVVEYNKKILKSNVLTVKEIFIALAGPLFNLLIILFGLVYNFSDNIIYSNFLILIFNLIPIYPLDGGRILKNILKLFFGNRNANKFMNLITNLLFIILTMLSSILILIYKNISVLVIIVTLWIIINRENRKYFTYNKIYKIIDKSPY